METRRKTVLRVEAMPFEWVAPPTTARSGSFDQANRVEAPDIAFKNRTGFDF